METRNQMVRSHFRGYPIIRVNGKWVYRDTGEMAGFDGTIRPCKKCGKTFGGSDMGDPDPCLGNLPGVDNACCGHGVREDSYIRFTNGLVVKGFEIEYTDNPTQKDGKVNEY